MGKESIRIKSERLLIVEGIEDKNFFNRLLGQLRFEDIIQVIDVEGKTKFKDTLTAISLLSDYESVTHLAIVGDSDESPKDTFRSLTGTLRALEFNVPQKPLEFSRDISSKPATMVYLMPDPNSIGSLESLFLRYLEQTDSQVVKCVEDYIQCVNNPYLQIQAKQDKAKLQALTAVIDKKPKRPEDALKNWDLNHPVFEGVQQFIHQLATEQPA